MIKLLLDSNITELQNIDLQNHNQIHTSESNCGNHPISFQNRTTYVVCRFPLGSQPCLIAIFTLLCFVYLGYKGYALKPLTILDWNFSPLDGNGLKEDLAGPLEAITYYPNDFRGKLLLQYRNIGGAKRYFFLIFRSAIAPPVPLALHKVCCGGERNCKLEKKF